MIEEKTKCPDRILFCRQIDGTPLYLVRSKKIPGLYVAEEPLRLRPAPKWLALDPKEAASQMTPWERFLSHLGL